MCGFTGPFSALLKLPFDSKVSSSMGLVADMDSQQAQQQVGAAPATRASQAVQQQGWVVGAKAAAASPSMFSVRQLGAGWNSCKQLLTLECRSGTAVAHLGAPVTVPAVPYCCCRWWRVPGPPAIAGVLLARMSTQLCVYVVLCVVAVTLCIRSFSVHGQWSGFMHLLVVFPR